MSSRTRPLPPKRSNAPAPVETVAEINDRLQKLGQTMLELRPNYLKVRESLDLIETFAASDNYSCTEEERERMFDMKRQTDKDDKILDDYKKYKKNLKEVLYLQRKKQNLLFKEQETKQQNLVFNPSNPQNPNPSSTFIDALFQKMFF